MARRVALAILVLMMVLPVASASTWRWGAGTDVDVAGCADDVQCAIDRCFGGQAPPQAVDFALHCAGSGDEDEIVTWGPRYAWGLADWAASTALDPISGVHEQTESERRLVNTHLCGRVWSRFCEKPIELPPVADPLGPYPL